MVILKGIQMIEKEVETISNMSRSQLETELEDRQLNFPRVTPEIVDSLIVDTQYHIFYGVNNTMVCCLNLVNGFSVTGESACISDGNFDETVCKGIALKKATDKIYSLAAYSMCNDYMET